MSHFSIPIPGGAKCTCGKEFRYEPKWPGDYQRMINLAHANSHRHAVAANKKEAKDGSASH